MPLSTFDWNGSESWKSARLYADQLKPIPPSVSDAISVLWRNAKENLDSESPDIQQKSLDIVARVDKTSVIKTPLYFAALELFEEKFEWIQEDDTSRALLKILGLEMFSNLLGLIYLHRRLNKIVVDELWEELSREYVLNMQLGYLIGEEITGIGGATGMLVGGIRYAALGTLLKHSPVEFLKYRNSNSGLINRMDEHKRWGCDHSQIAAILLRSLGFDLDPLNCGNALRPERALDGNLPAFFAPWRATTLLVEHAFEKEIPNQTQLDDAGIEVKHAAIAQLFSSLETYVDNGTTFKWMFRSSKSKASSEGEDLESLGEDSSEDH